MPDMIEPQKARVSGLTSPKRCTRCNEIVPFEKLAEHAEIHLGPIDVIGELAKAAADPFWRER